MKSEDVIHYGSSVRASNNNARSWMLRDQLNKYRRNLSEMAKSITRHIKNNSRESRFTMPRLFREKSRSCLMMAAGLKSPAQLGC